MAVAPLVFFVGAQDTGRAPPIHSSARYAGPTERGGILGAGSLGNLDGVSRPNTLLRESQQPKRRRHEFLATAVLAAAPSRGGATTLAGITRRPAQRVPLSSALGQTEAAGVGNAASAGMVVAGVRAGAGAGAGVWTRAGAAWEGSGAGSTSFTTASAHPLTEGVPQLSAQDGAGGGAMQQPPPIAARSAGDQLDALLLSAAVGDIEAGGEKEDDGDGAPIAIDIPPELSLNARSWCCSRGETIRSICSKCLKRWHCHVEHGLIEMKKDRFICCFCDVKSKTGCRCHS